MNNHLFSLVVVPASGSKALLAHGRIVFLTNNHPWGKISGNIYLHLQISILEVWLMSRKDLKSEDATKIEVSILNTCQQSKTVWCLSYFCPFFLTYILALLSFTGKETEKKREKERESTCLNDYFGELKW